MMLKRPDCLVNSAGIVRSKRILELSEKEPDQMFDINLKDAFFICQSVLIVDGLAEERLAGIIDAIPLKRTGTTT